jgi:DNA mismatch repair ATPase MutS
VSTDLLCQLGPEIALLIGAANLFDRFGQAGLPVCRPDYVAADQRYAELLDAYDPSLAWEQLADAQHLVTNRVQFDAVGRVWVLTGPNRGGKTTYTRTVGLAHVLFQTGMLVAAREAQLSPADAIFTHFPAREESRLGLGALDVEAERLAAIFGKATPGSLILLNEALAGTSALEALDLARGIVRGLRLLGARAIYVTHLHELASCVDELNATTPGDSVVASLVADSDTGPVNGSTPRRRRTYRIVPGPPRGLSFAAEIAEQHGISYPQLARVLNDRARERLSH